MAGKKGARHNKTLYANAREYIDKNSVVTEHIFDGVPCRLSTKKKGNGPTEHRTSTWKFEHGREHGAHRISWIADNGPVPDDKPFICHRCNNAACVEPRHLYAGTPYENAQDRKIAGTLWTPSMQEGLKKNWDNRRASGTTNTNTSVGALKGWETRRKNAAEKNKT